MYLLFLLHCWWPIDPWSKRSDPINASGCKIKCFYQYVKYWRSSTSLLHRQAWTRKSHWGCPTRASEKRREQGIFPLGFTILEYCFLNILPNDNRYTLDDTLIYTIVNFDSNLLQLNVTLGVDLKVLMRVIKHVIHVIIGTNNTNNTSHHVNRNNNTKGLPDL